jgi:hypothetical protein
VVSHAWERVQRSAVQRFTPLLPCICYPFAALVSRQFLDMTRIRIEGLLAAFPKLVSTGKQHTYVETENVRYLYQPLEVRWMCVDVCVDVCGYWREGGLA